MAAGRPRRHRDPDVLHRRWRLQGVALLHVGPHGHLDAVDASGREVEDQPGPIGAFELDGFAEGTVELARKAAALTRAGRLISVAGGGDTVAALGLAGVIEDFSYVSTAGGAFLEWLEGKELPGVAALAR